MVSRRVAVLGLGLAVVVGVVLWPYVPATVLSGTPGDTARVAVTDGDRTLGVVTATVADTRTERYRGLSDRSSLAPDEGMLFVFNGERNRSFVMREMAFGIDIIFVGADGRITAVHSADPPPPDTAESDLRRYTGRARWVLEVNKGWAAGHNVSVGDHVDVGTVESLESPG